MKVAIVMPFIYPINYTIPEQKAIVKCIIINATASLIPHLLLISHIPPVSRTEFKHVHGVCDDSFRNSDLSLNGGAFGA